MKKLIDTIQEQDKPKVQLAGRDESILFIAGQVMQAWRRQGHRDIQESTQ